MGEIVYCVKCGDRILASDFEKGRALVILRRNYCATCADAIKDNKPEPVEEVTARRIERRPTIRILSLAKPLLSRTRIIVIISIAVLLLALVVVIVTRR